MESTSYDAMVIGSGAAGSFAVKELTEKGLNVILLEAGRSVSKNDFKAVTPDSEVKEFNLGTRLGAALRGQHVQARYAMFKDLVKDFYVNDRKNPYSTPRDNFFLWLRGRQLGGRLHTWGRMALRMSDYDFKAAGLDGYDQDWPICYDDLASYYEQVEDFLGIYGSEENISQFPDNHYIWETKLTRVEHLFKQAVEHKWKDRHVVPLRLVKPNLERVPLPILAALETGRLTLRTDAVVKRITVDSRTGRANGAEFFDRITKKQHSISARIVMVCASTIESIRLLLNSACPSHPNGLGNASGNLGRYFMEQNTSVIKGLIPGIYGWEQDSNLMQDNYAPNAGVYIPRFRNIPKPKSEFIRGYGIQGSVGALYTPPDKPAMFGFMAYGETLPNSENRVTVHSSKTDSWGIPIAHIDCRFRENEERMMADSLNTLKEIALENKYHIQFAGNCRGVDENASSDVKGVGGALFKTFFKKTMGPGSAIHECGGIRMGNDPESSVLNAHNQCWDIDNLFVTDGSCFATTGSVGPTLTIMAVTVRACEYIAGEFEKGNL